MKEFSAKFVESKEVVQRRAVLTVNGYAPAHVVVTIIEPAKQRELA